MNEARLKPIPLPCALLALSVVMCLGAAGPIEASTLRGASTTQEQRETIEHLLDAIQQAAKKLTDQLTGQSAVLQRVGGALGCEHDAGILLTPGDDVPGVLFLRDALLNLPPPSC